MRVFDPPPPFGPLTARPKVFGFFALLLVLALRQKRLGAKHVWLAPVSAISWFGPRGRDAGKLPAPVTHRSRSQSRRPKAAAAEVANEKEKTRARSQSRPAADVRRNESQRALVRDDSYRANDPRSRGLNRDDSRKTTDSRRPLLRDDSRRTTDSRRPLNRDDSYRTVDSRREIGRAHV